MTELSTVSPGKTLVFYSPLDGEDVLVRSGVNQENDLGIYHAVLLGSSAEYVREDEDGRREMAERLLEKLAGKVERREEKVPPFDPSLYSKIFSKNLEGVYSLVSTESEKLICELLPVGLLKSEIIPRVLKFSPKNQTEFQSHFENLALALLSDQLFKAGWNPSSGSEDKKMQKKKELLEERGISLFRKAKEEEKPLSHRKSSRSPRSSRSSRKKKHSSSLSDLLPALSKRINRNIYVLDSKTRLPLKILDSDSKYSKSIIILRLSGGYETVGKLLEKNKVQREFADGVLVDKIRTVLYKPHRLEKLYPELVECVKGEKSRSKSRSKSSSSNSRSSSSSSSSTSSSSKSD